jgi:hypothetical protein
MKTPTVLVLGIALLLAFAVTLSSAPPPGNERIFQQELKQQQIQKTTQRVADQLSSVINEFERNGIAGEDVKVLRAIRMVLGRLTEREMAQVVTLLQEAQKSDNDLTTKKNVTEAYSSQKTIITQLKQLLLEYQRQQALYEISLMLRGLASRQSANMRLGVWLARTTDQKGANGFSEDEKRYLQQQGIDQSSLRDETLLVIKKIEALEKETDGTATGDRPKAALEQVKSGGLVAALDAAIDDLKNSKLLSATSNEKKARDQMRDVARALLMSKDLVDLLRAAIQETENTIAQQKNAMEFTRKMERRDEAREAEDKQFEVVDNTDLTRRDINDVVPTAASYFRDAIGKMQEARATFSGNKDIKVKVKEAPPKQMEAMTNLELAKRELQEALAKAEKEAQKPDNILAGLRELKKQVEELIKREEKLKTETAAIEKPQELKPKAPEQGDIRDNTQEAQQKAANDAPEAASALNEAANQMEKSQKDLAQSKNSPEAQQAAVDSLKKATEELDKQIAKLEAAEKQLAQLEKLREKVEKVITDEQKIRIDTAREAVKEKPDSLSQVASKQEQTGKETAELKNEAQEPVPSAAEHLDKAKNQMSDAKAQLDKSQPKEAQPPETKALKELYAAKKDIESKMDELRKQLGLPEESAQSLADASAALEKAQNEVNDAMAQMADTALMDALQKKQEAIANALADQNKTAPSEKTSGAQKAAQQAAQQLAQSNLKEAIGSMEKAESAIDSAAASQPQPKSAPDSPSLPELGKEQSAVKQMAKQLLAAQENAGQQAMQAAQNFLEQALNDVSPIAAGQAGQLPAAADQAVQQAQDALTQAAAQAGAQQAQPAQANAQQAAQALAQAQAALALAQAGLNSEMAGQQPGKGQQPGQGQGQQGQGQSQGQGQQPGKGQGTPPPKGNGQDGNWSGAGGANGPRNGAAGSSSFVGLPKRDRAAIQQSQAEKYPQEYGPLVEQYLKNLSDQSGQ